MNSRTQSRRRKASRRSNAQQDSLIMMTPKTKDFIQKICYKKTASIDMTKNGFITESRMGPINVYVKPLREQIQKIVEEPAPKRKEDKLNLLRRHRVASSSKQGPTLCLPDSNPQPSPNSPRPLSDESLNQYMAAKIRKKSVVFSL